MPAVACRLQSSRLERGRPFLARQKLQREENGGEARIRAKQGRRYQRADCLHNDASEDYEKAVEGWGERWRYACRERVGRRRTRLRDCSVAAAANFPRPVAAASLRFARRSARWRSLQLQRVQIEPKEGQESRRSVPDQQLIGRRGRKKNWVGILPALGSPAKNLNVSDGGEAVLRNTTQQSKEAIDDECNIVESIQDVLDEGERDDRTAD